MPSSAEPDREAPDLRTARARRTREAIHAAALRLAVERGYEATTMEDVATQAGVSRRTVFNYFPTKVDLFMRAPQVPEQADIETFVSGDGDLLNDLVQLVARANPTTGPQAEEFRILRQVLHDNPSLRPELQSRVRLFHSVIRAAIARRLDADLRDPRVIVAAAICSALNKAAVDLWAGGSMDQLDQLDQADQPDQDGPAGQPAPNPAHSYPLPETVHDALTTVTTVMRELLSSTPAA